MTADKDLRDLTRAINKLHDVIASLNANLVRAENNKAVIRQAERNKKFLTGEECTEYGCSFGRPHTHGESCTGGCPCLKVIMRARDIENSFQPVPGMTVAEAAENLTANAGLFGVCGSCFSHLCRPDGPVSVEKCNCCKNNHVIG